MNPRAPATRVDAAADWLVAEGHTKPGRFQRWKQADELADSRAFLAWQLGLEVPGVTAASAAS